MVYCQVFLISIKLAICCQLVPLCLSLTSTSPDDCFLLITKELGNIWMVCVSFVSYVMVLCFKFMQQVLLFGVMDHQKNQCYAMLVGRDGEQRAHWQTTSHFKLVNIRTWRELKCLKHPNWKFFHLRSRSREFTEGCKRMLPKKLNMKHHIVDKTSKNFLTKMLAIDPVLDQRYLFQRVVHILPHQIWMIWQVSKPFSVY